MRKEVRIYLKYPNDYKTKCYCSTWYTWECHEKIELNVPSRCRLRHERLKKVPRDVGGPNAYQTLTCFELADTPALPHPPSSSSIDDPFDITI